LHEIKTRDQNAIWSKCKEVLFVRLGCHVKPWSDRNSKYINFGLVLWSLKIWSCEVWSYDLQNAHFNIVKKTRFILLYVQSCKNFWSCEIRSHGHFPTIFVSEGNCWKTFVSTSVGHLTNGTISVAHCRFFC
jgi:hypothetical protein